MNRWVAGFGLWGIPAHFSVLGRDIPRKHIHIHRCLYVCERLSACASVASVILFTSYTLDSVPARGYLFQNTKHTHERGCVFLSHGDLKVAPYQMVL